MNDYKLTLRMLRAKFSYTQDEVAEKLNISPSTWSKWERGINFPDVINIKKIENLFNVSYADIKFLQ